MQFAIELKKNVKEADGRMELMPIYSCTRKDVVIYFEHMTCSFTFRVTRMTMGYVTQGGRHDCPIGKLGSCKSFGPRGRGREKENYLQGVGK